MAARQLCRPGTQGSMAEHDTVDYHTADVLRLQDKLRRLWRVETLQQLDEEQVEEAEEEKFEELTTGSESASRLPNHIGPLLKKHCEDSFLYLQKDLTLMRLSTEIGTNRTYLSAYFQQQGITYNAYINRLRIEHFIQIYRDSIDTNKPFSVQEKATESGFQSYRTFATAFKTLMGMTASEWMEKEKEKET